MKKITDKSYVTLEQAVCPVCGVTFETSTLLFDRYLRDRFDRHTCTHLELCPKHQQLYDDGYIALVAIDEEKSKISLNGTVKPEDAYRTGEICHIKSDKWENIFNIPPPAPDSSHVYCESAVIKQLEKMSKGE